MYASFNVFRKTPTMKFGVFTHAGHFLDKGKLYSYGPYVREINIWIKHFQNTIVVAPKNLNSDEKIELPYNHPFIIFQKLPFIHLKDKGFFPSFLKSIIVFLLCLKHMKSCQHIHIRCPGNIGNIALIASLFYPHKPKTIKYAGNWDPNSTQPLSYRFQKGLLNNKWLIRNKKVLIYGQWPGQPEHIISFFTASFSELDKIKISKSFDDNFKFIYCGAMVPGKQPLLAIQIIHELLKDGYPVYLDMYGDGIEKDKLEAYILENELSGRITIHGNQPQSILLEAYKKSHFCILPSRSEGWPKAIAEGMFFGCVPIATEISCIPWMLDKGNRGIIMDENLTNTTRRIKTVMKSEKQYCSMSRKAMEWSREYTTEKFEKEIKEVL
jgi:glycosyltransferase involved in cell wall biosynthesis